MTLRSSTKPHFASTRLLAMALAAALTTATSTAQISYSSDFEGVTFDDPAALSAAPQFWQVFGNVFDGTTSAYMYGYGPNPAPNSNAPATMDAFSAVTTGQGGPDQGAQGLVVFSDYQSGEHDNGNLVESNVYQEFTITAGDAGDYVFQFDAKKGDLAPPSTALAFIKILNPATGFSVTDSATLDTSNLPVEWGTYTLNITVEAGQAGQLLQFGFACTATSYATSGVYYDNVSFTTDVPETLVKITGITKDGESVTVTFQSELDALYELLKSPNGLDSFTAVDGETGILGDGDLVETYDDFATEPKAFYQVRKLP